MGVGVGYGVVGRVRLGVIGRRGSIGVVAYVHCPPEAWGCRGLGFDQDRALCRCMARLPHCLGSWLLGHPVAFQRLCYWHGDCNTPMQRQGSESARMHGV
jgi:hypothetical protein